ncbi:MAG: Dihydroorotate dehydrogenase (quinone), mitochondrial [Vezdaea aestivalis]|nr:MAG: Dihydroorotate dehydrogenase (quinone), mitochondrial [Vezdaea aestivalis]
MPPIRRFQYHRPRFSLPLSSPRLSFRPTVCRHASTSTHHPPTLLTRLRTLFVSTTIVFSLGTLYFYITDTRASIHRYIVPPLLRLLYPSAEASHHAGTSALRTLYSLNSHPRERSGPILPITVFGQPLASPLAISAGLDKNAEVPDVLFALGAAIVEVGGVTPLPQPGNAKPRVFRLPSIEALINRYGLNSEGVDAVAARLRKRVRRFARASGKGVGQRGEDWVCSGEADVPVGSLQEGRLLAVQIGANKATDLENAEAVKRDYMLGVKELGKFADVLVVNVSSPNTAGLRGLQDGGKLRGLLGAVVGEAKRISLSRRERLRVMVKVSPDEDSEGQVRGVCGAVVGTGVDGVIVGNTTTTRPGIQGLGAEESAVTSELGGYSGPAMFEKTLDLVGRYRTLLDEAVLGEKDTERKVIFASGGITDGKRATEVLEKGASVAMVYTALVSTRVSPVPFIVCPSLLSIVDDAADIISMGTDL